MDGWVDFGVDYILRWFTCPQTVTHPKGNHLTGSRTRDLLTTSSTSSHPESTLPEFSFLGSGGCSVSWFRRYPFLPTSACSSSSSSSCCFATSQLLTLSCCCSCWQLITCCRRHHCSCFDVAVWRCLSSQRVLQLYSERKRKLFPQPQGSQGGADLCFSSPQSAQIPV